MEFVYEAFDKNGKKIKGKIEAEDIQEAKTKLQNYFVVSIKPKKKGLFTVFKKRVSQEEIADIFYSLALYLKASIPLRTSLSLLTQQYESGATALLLNNLIHHIDEGKSFSVALEMEKKRLSIPSYFIRAVKVGEESGRLDLVLKELSMFLKEEERMRSQVAQAFVYPSFIVVVAIGMISFMLTNVVPKIVKVVKNLHQELPKMTQTVITLSNFLKEYGILILLLFLFVGSIFFLMYKKTPFVKRAVDGTILKLYPFSMIALNEELGRFSYLVFIMTRSGINYVHAIEMAISIITNSVIREYFEKAFVKVKEGNRLSLALKQVGFDLDKKFIQTIGVGEETGNLSQLLENLSELYFTKNKERIETLLKLIEPVLIVVIGSVIGFIVVALLMPMLKMNAIL